MKCTVKNFLFFLFVMAFSFLKAQTKTKSDQYINSSYQITAEGAMALMKSATATAETLNKKVTIAVVDVSGNTISSLRGDGIGPHNTEAARRKAYTSLSTKTPTLELMRNAAKSDDAKNLNTLPELLLLSGGSPLYFEGKIIGAIGIAGGGSAENDDMIAKSANIPEAGISSIK